MYTLVFKLNNTIAANAKKLVVMFMEDWISMSVQDTDYTVSVSTTDDTLVTVQLVYREDAVALRLRGIPRNLSKFINVVETV